MNREEGGRRMNKGKSGCAPAVCCHRPQQLPASQLRPPLPVSATCVWPYLAAASLTTTTAAHSTPLQPSPELPHSGSAGSTAVLTTDVVAVTSVWVCLVSPVGLVCVICPASSAIHGTSCHADDVVAARDFKLRLRREVNCR